MVKIKRKVEMVLPELIKWGWKNGKEQRIFRGSKNGGVRFNRDSWVTIETAVEPDETFTVEVKEEITEKNKIPILIEVYKTLGGEVSSFAYSDKSINYVLTINELYQNRPAIAFYMLNDDMTMTLLWKDGAMIE
ncbi:hypothetical protein BU582_00720 [Staphylococcus agnetis]|uniref:hypothetical protein n=1 Tax=Staphylococcus agnetis TaxID=985762 RepID=UPI000D1A744C|nr:hypothetical protein [Staphylococcus agnetis]PTH68889.1 hypothetical protein BU582_00720 [Staphylococcus agnetis]